MAIEPGKSPLLSKTLWGNFILAGLALFAPGVSTYLGSNPDIIVYAFAGLNILLRLVTKDKIQLL